MSMLSVARLERALSQVDQMPARDAGTNLKDYLEYQFFRDGTREEIAQPLLTVDEKRLAEMVEETFNSTSQTATDNSLPHLCASALHNALPAILRQARSDDASYNKLLAEWPNFINAMVDWSFSRQDVDEVGLLEQLMGDCDCFSRIQWGSRGDKKILQDLHSGTLFEESPHAFTTTQVIASIAYELLILLACPVIQSIDDRKLTKITERKGTNARGHRKLARYLQQKPGHIVQACYAWYIPYKAGTVFLFLQQFNRHLPNIFQPALMKKWPQLPAHMVTFTSAILDLAATPRHKIIPASACRRLVDPNAEFLRYITADGSLSPDIRKDMLLANGEHILLNDLVRLITGLETLPAEYLRNLNDTFEVPENLAVAALQLYQWLALERPADAPPLLWHETINKWVQVPARPTFDCCEILTAMNEWRKVKTCMYLSCGMSFGEGLNLTKADRLFSSCS